MKKKNKWKWAAALVLGIVLAVLFEGIIALYRVNRGYGNEKTAFLLAAESGNDYVVGEKRNALGENRDTALYAFSS